MIPPIGELTFDEPLGDVYIKYRYIKGEPNYVIKIAKGYWKNHELGIPNGNGMMLLFNQKTGQPLAILIDHGILTDVRIAIANQSCAKNFSNKIKKIGAIGSDTYSKRELGSGIIEKTNLVIADGIEQCKYRVEIACSIKDGNLNLDNVVELSDVLSGKISGRDSKSQITVSDLTGVAVKDVRIANSVFKKFMEDKNEI